MFDSPKHAYATWPALFQADAITGPRQSGKTTLRQYPFPQYGYVSFDSPETRAFFDDDPKGFIISLSAQVVLDEVQRVPGIFEYPWPAISRGWIPAGAIYQNYVIAEIAKDAAHRSLDWKLHYYRTNAGLESDFVIEDRERRRILFVGDRAALRLSRSARQRFRPMIQ